MNALALNKYFNLTFTGEWCADTKGVLSDQFHAWSVRELGRRSFDLESLEYCRGSLLDAPRGRLDALDRIRGSTSPSEDVAEGVVTGVHAERRADDVSGGLGFEFLESTAQVLGRHILRIMQEGVANLVGERLGLLRLGVGADHANESRRVGRVTIGPAIQGLGSLDAKTNTVGELGEPVEHALGRESFQLAHRLG